VDVLQSTINASLHAVLLQRPLNLHCSASFPIIQYEDDTLILMQADVRQIQHLTDVLKVFGAASGLDVNYYKSSHIPINIEDRIQTLTASL
jgi:hypothetical protein